ncbi:MAG TPA: acyl carrier protein [Polyangiaceae bacterium]|jgi:acyl carrier protein
MIRTWISAAAAAGSLSAGLPPEVAPTFTSQAVETRAQPAPPSERARIVGIATEVRRLVVRFAEADPAAIVAPRPLRDLGVDELALADVVLGLETRFGIDIEGAEAAAWETVGDVVGFVARRVREISA